MDKKVLRKGNPAIESRARRCSFMWFYVIVGAVCISNIVVPLGVQGLKRLNESAGWDIAKLRAFDPRKHVSLLSWGECVPVSQGFGHDGVAYAKICREFPEILFSNEYRYFRKTQFIPSALAYLVIKLTPLSFDAPDIVLAFRIVNVVVLLMSIRVLLLICERMNLSYAGTWLAFIGVFVNFMVLKFSMYTPVLTDFLAFLLGLLLFLFYLTDSPIGIFAITLIGLFTWPTLVGVAALLFVFPCGSASECAPAGRFAKYVIPLALGMTYCVFSVIRKHYAYFGGESILQSAVPLSLILVVAYLALGWLALIDAYNLLDVGAIFQHIRPVVGLGILAVLVVAYNFLVTHVLHTMHYPLLTTLNLLAVRPILQPFGFYIAHVTFFGPVLLFTLLMWKRVTAVAAEYGVGIVFVLAYGFLFALDSESRHLLGFMPMVVVLTAKALDHLSFSHRDGLAFGAISLLYSKFWLLINTGPMPAGQYLDFPWQNYFMNFGPWMSNEMYFVHLLAVGATAIWMYLRLSELKRKSRECTSNGIASCEEA